LHPHCSVARKEYILSIVESFSSQETERERERERKREREKRHRERGRERERGRKKEREWRRRRGRERQREREREIEREREREKKAEVAWNLHLLCCVADSWERASGQDQASTAALAKQKMYTYFRTDF
jgi:hypothetical protein